MSGIDQPIARTYHAARRAIRWLRDPYAVLRRDAAEEGRFTFVRPLPTLGPTLLTGDPEVVAEIVNHPALDAGRGIVGLRAILGSGSLIMSDGEEHVRRRAVVAPSLRGSALDAYPALFERVTRELSARAPERFSGHALVHAVSLHAIARVVFGEEDPALVAEAVRRIDRFLATFRHPLPLFVRPLQVDLGRWSGWGRALRRKQAVAELCLERMDRGRGMLAELRGRAPDLPAEELVDEVLALLLFGHDTGAATMAWALAHLHAHGHAERAAEDDGWLESCLRESMRACPVVPHLTRVVREPTRIAGHDLVEGQRVAPSPWLAHHHPGSWPDPDRFDPARFDRPPAPHSWFPFGLGARVCVGRPFVLLQMRVVVGTLLRELPARLAPEASLRPVRRLVLVVPEGGVPMVRTRPRGARKPG